MIDYNLVDVAHKPITLDGHEIPPGLLEDPDDPRLEAFGMDWPSSLLLYRGPDEWRRRLQEIRDAFGTYEPMREWLYAHNDQSPESSCVFNADECAYRGHWVRALGVDFELKWAPMWGYQFNCGGRHSGSYTMDALEFSTNVGHCPEASSARSSNPRLTLCHERAKALCPHVYHQNTPYQGKRQFEEAKATAKHFRVTKWVRLRNEDQYASSLLNLLGNVNGRRGHSIFQESLLEDGRDWFSVYLDSYDTDRGNDGRLMDSRRGWAWSGAWAPLEVTLPANPIFPCGTDTKPVSFETYERLYPTVDRDYLSDLFDAGPEGLPTN